jgi:hypothetical protein
VSKGDDETNIAFLLKALYCLHLDRIKAKAKAVPLHATEVRGGGGGIAPTHSRPRH